MEVLEIMFYALKKSILFILLTTCTACFCKPKFGILEHAGAYLAASDANEKLNNSICGKLIINKNPTTLEKAIADIKSKLKKEDLFEFNSYISSIDHNEKMMKNKHFIDAFISDAKNRNVDFKFSCGILTGMITTINEPIFENWSSTNFRKN